MQRQVSQAQGNWEQQCWHLGNRRFACEADARAALERELKGKPSWLEIQHEFVAHPHHEGQGRPRKDASPATYQWQIVATVKVNQKQVEEETARKACWIIGTNVLEMAVLSDQQLVTTYKEQGGVERGFRFLKDPLFLASSVFVKKPERLIALSLIMVLCLTSLPLSRISAAGTPGRDRANHSRPGSKSRRHARRCGGSFNAFCGIELLHVQTATTSLLLVLRLQPVHRLILQLLGPLYEHIYTPSG